MRRRDQAWAPKDPGLTAPFVNNDGWQAPESFALSVAKVKNHGEGFGWSKTF
jgi:hypothetical protein